VEGILRWRGRMRKLDGIKDDEFREQIGMGIRLERLRRKKGFRDVSFESNQIEVELEYLRLIFSKYSTLIFLY
jgi:hypothetical protein